MNNTEFEKILDTRIKAIRETLAGKAKEYASEDRLYNFKLFLFRRNYNELFGTNRSQENR